jgi:hypothetical protein
VNVTPLKSAPGSTAVHSDSACVTAASSCGWVTTAVGSTGVAGSLDAVSGLGVGVGVAVVDELVLALELGLADGSGAYVVSTLGVALGVGDGDAVGDPPDVHVTELPSAERVQTIFELVADAVGLGVGAGVVLDGVGSTVDCCEPAALRRAAARTAACRASWAGVSDGWTSRTPPGSVPVRALEGA